jgi:hypothetical protein
VREVLSQLRAHSIPVSAFWLQDWVGQRRTSIGWQLWWNWQLDRAHYPDWENLAQEIKGGGAHLLAYVNPFLAQVGQRAEKVWKFHGIDPHPNLSCIAVILTVVSHALKVRARCEYQKWCSKLLVLESVLAWFTLLIWVPTAPVPIIQNTVHEL